MKANKKTGGLKGLLLNHCEKAVVAAFVLAAGWLMYSSLSVETETREPSQLNTAVNQTKTAFEGSKWSDVSPEDQKIAASVAAQEEVVISPEAYPNALGLNIPVVPPTIDRVDPTLLAATDLEVSAVTGLMAFIDDDIRRQRDLEEKKKQLEREQEQKKARENDDPLDRLGGGRGGRGGEGGAFGRGLDEGNGKRRPVANRIRQGGILPQGDERIETVSTAIVLAKAPVIEQLNAYKTALEGARGYSPQGDVPRYFGYYVERADVVDGAEPVWRKVKVVGITGGNSSPIVSQSAIASVLENWSDAPEPLVDSRYEHPALTFPLPPLVGKPWGTEVVHSDAPLQSETDAKEASELKNEDEGVEDGAAEGEDDEESIFDRGFADSRDLGRGRGGARGGGRGGEFSGGRAGRGGMRGGGAEMMGRGMMGRGMSAEMSGPGMGGEMGGRGGGGMRRRGGSEFVIDEDVPFAMIRFFDHTVQPGKRYRYRVRLILEDVNHGVDERSLAREVIERREALKKNRRSVRFAEWSEPSPIVTIPQAGDVYLAAVKPPSAKQVGGEGRVTLLMQSYSKNEDLPPRAIQVALEQDFLRGGVLNLTKDAEFITPDRRFIEEYDSFPFRTGVTLVDYDGGQTITRDISSPGKVLLMDAGGRLFVRHELDDAQEVVNHEALFKGEDQGRGGGRGGEFFEGGRGGRGGF